MIDMEIFNPSIIIRILTFIKIKKESNHMDPHMTIEIARLRKIQQTKPTLIWFLTRMRPKMFD